MIVVVKPAERILRRRTHESACLRRRLSSRQGRRRSADLATDLCHNWIHKYSSPPRLVACFRQVVDLYACAALPQLSQLKSRGDTEKKNYQRLMRAQEAQLQEQVPLPQSVERPHDLDACLTFAYSNSTSISSVLLRTPVSQERRRSLLEDRERHLEATVKSRDDEIHEMSTQFQRSYEEVRVLCLLELPSVPRANADYLCTSDLLAARCRPGECCPKKIC